MHGSEKIVKNYIKNTTGLVYKRGEYFARKFDRDFKTNLKTLLKFLNDGTKILEFL